MFLLKILRDRLSATICFKKHRFNHIIYYIYICMCLWFRLPGIERDE